jgi:hypothetical protein
MIDYIPQKLETPKLAVESSAWGDIPTIIKDIIDRFGIKQNKALEFGVEWGYSTSALANYFDSVIGVDTFTGDINSGVKANHYNQTQENLKDFKNIKLVQSDYQDYIKNDNDYYDLIHIDIVHNYNHTYNCGEWAVQHSNVVIFHDTESFREVKMACENLTNDFNLDFYNYNRSNGLGILVKK